jgi:rhamnose transport system ATP-binding protein
VLSVRSLSKSYAGHPVVDRVSVDVERGEIHAIVGENGAGKTTLLQMIAGLVRSDSGTVSVDGVFIPARGRITALRAGIAMVTQELATIPSRSVLENVYLGCKSPPLGSARAHFSADFEKLTHDAGIYLNPTVSAGALSLADRQLLEILRALAADPKVLLLDEPTTAMSFDQSDNFRRLVGELAQQGKVIIWVSHRLEELRSNAHRVTVMRDGAVVGTGPASEFTEMSMVHLMVGYPVDVAFPPPGEIDRTRPAALRVRDLCCYKESVPLTLEVRCGEIVGCSGLVGAGRSSLARAVFGAVPPASGSISIGGGPWFRPTTVRRAIAAGLGMVPEDRKRQGLVLRRSVAENLMLPSLQLFTRFGLLTKSKAKKICAKWVTESGVRPASPSIAVESLSGGNQQKVLAKKWLQTDPKVMIFDEPTRGVSMDAKVQIHRLIVETAERGVGVLLLSSELDEVLGLSHRTLVFRDGGIVAEFGRETASRELVMSAAFGVRPEAIRDDN